MLKYNLYIKNTKLIDLEALNFIWTNENNNVIKI
jgi:hypothetical protein